MAAGLGFKDFTTGEVLTAADVDGYLMQGIWVFASTAARDAAVTSPSEGNFAFTKDTNSLWYYDGAAWVASGATGDIEGVTAGTGISGGGTSGTVTITNSMATAIDAKGDLVAGTGADAFSRLAVGANNTVLTADSAEATGLKWAAAASGGGMTLISETAASAVSSITFNSLGSYKQLVLVWYGVKHSGSGSEFSMRLNNDSTASIYEGRGTSAVGTSFITVGTDVDSLSPIGNIQFFMFGKNATGGQKEASSGYVIIDNYTSTTKFKTVNCKFAYYDVSLNTSNEVNANMFYRSTSAVTSLDIVRLSGSATISNDTNTVIRLYGVS